MIGRSAALFSWLDVKLGLRMFAKYPALSIIGPARRGLAVQPTEALREE